MKNTQLPYAIAALFAVGIVCATVLSFFPGDHTSAITAIGTLMLMGAGFLHQNFKVQTVEKKLDDNTTATLETQNELTDTKKSINGMKSELVEAVRGRAVAEGTLAGAAREQERVTAESAGTLDTAAKKLVEAAETAKEAVIQAAEKAAATLEEKAKGLP